MKNLYSETRKIVPLVELNSRLDTIVYSSSRKINNVFSKRTICAIRGSRKFWYKY